MREFKISGKTFREDLRYLGISYLEETNAIFSIARNPKVMICSRCSKTKSGIPRGVPEQFYISDLNMKFYKWCKYYKFRYGILSDKYGIHLDMEILDWYDIHPGTLSNDELKKLGEIIKEKMIEQKKNNFLFYNSSPIMSVPYFHMMKYSGYPINFITKLQYETRGFFSNVE